MKYIQKLFILLIASLIVAGCTGSNDTEDSPDSEITIFTSVYPFKYAAEEIAGDTVTVETIFPPGTDEHTYEPTSKEIVEIAESNAFIYLGANLEAFSTTIADAVSSHDVLLVEIAEHKELFDYVHNEADEHEHDSEHNHDHESEHKAEEPVLAQIEGHSPHYHTGDTMNLKATLNEDIDYEEIRWFILNPDEEDWTVLEDELNETIEMTAEIDGQQIKAGFINNNDVVAETTIVTVEIDDHEGDNDPHIWIDPLKMVQISEIIKDVLIEINPDETELYNANFEILSDKLTELDREFTEVLSEKENTKIMVSHAAFGYWERYGIEQIAISGLSTTDEPSQKQLTEIVEQSKEHNLNYVIFEQNTSNRLAEVIQEEIGADSLSLHNLGVLTQDDIDHGEDYISLMKYNLEVLDQATK